MIQLTSLTEKILEILPADCVRELEMELAKSPATKPSETNVGDVDLAASSGHATTHVAAVTTRATAIAATHAATEAAAHTALTSTAAEAWLCFTVL